MCYFGVHMRNVNFSFDSGQIRITPCTGTLSVTECANSTTSTVGLGGLSMGGGAGGRGGLGVSRGLSTQCLLCQGNSRDRVTAKPDCHQQTTCSTMKYWLCRFPVWCNNKTHPSIQHHPCSFLSDATTEDPFAGVVHH